MDTVVNNGEAAGAVAAEAAEEAAAARELLLANLESKNRRAEMMPPLPSGLGRRRGQSGFKHSIDNVLLSRYSVLSHPILREVVSSTRPPPGAAR